MDITLVIIIFVVVLIAAIFLIPKKPPMAAVAPRRSQVLLIGAQGQTIPLDPARREPFCIGRGQDNQLRLDNDLVSRLHAQISLDGGSRWVLYDRSTNGTWVNQERIAQHYLRSGDQIQIGPAIFVFQDNRSGLVPSPQSSIIQQLPPVSVDAPDINLQNYQLLQELGGGGVAKVVKAQGRDGKFVAIKFLTQRDTYLRQKFQGEIRYGQTLRHPNIARIYGGGAASDGQLYLVMEFVDGDTLRHWTQTRLPFEQIVSMIGQTCDALHYAHGLGIYHRDIKPENIMINSRGQVKLIDFGIARITSQTTYTADGMIVGTPFYLSYEQAKGHRVDGRSDIYSLGIVLYELLTGCVPFYSPDPNAALQIVHYHVTQPPAPPTTYNPQIPPHLEKATLRCLEKDINRRFQNALELAQAIGYTSVMTGGTDDSIVQKPGLPGKLVIHHTGRIISLSYTQTDLYRRDIDPNDSLISRQHAQVIHQDGRFWLQDRSTNGTFLNGMRIDQPALLQPGDQVQIGNTLLHFET